MIGLLHDFARSVLRIARRLRWVVAGAAMAWLSILYLPIVPAQPICIHHESGGPQRALSGRLARDFHAQYVRLLADEIPFFTDGERVYVSLFHSLDSDLRISASKAALGAVFESRIDLDNPGSGLLPDHAEWGHPTCAAMAAIAFKGGVWEHEGPTFIPEGASEAEAAALDPPPAPIPPRLYFGVCFFGALLIAAVTALVVDQCRRWGWRRRGRVVEEAVVSAVQVFAATFAVTATVCLLIDQLLFLA